MGDRGGGNGNAGGPGRAALVGALALYLTLAAWGAYRHADDVNLDTITYARFAHYVGEGRFADAVAGCWSPMLPWSAAPLVAIGVEPFHALRVVLTVSGAALVVACWLFLGRLGALPRAWSTLAMLAVALVAAYVTVKFPNPDVMLSAWLWLYFYLATDPRLMERRGVQVAAGLCAGAAYLAKAYAMPVFLVHYPVTLALRYAALRRERRAPDARGAASIRRAALALGVALAAFAVVAGPWIGALSAKYGRFTTTTAGVINHAIAGPDVRYGVHPVREGLHAPSPGHIGAWETPEILPYRWWSPFSSVANARHQLKIVVTHLAGARTAFSEMDLFGFWLMLLAATPVLAALSWREREEPFLTAWVAVTTAIYVSGHLFVYFQNRYLVSVLHPLAVMWGLHVFSRFSAGARGTLKERPRLAKTAAALVFATAAASFLTVPVMRYAGYVFREDPYREYPAVARELREAGIEAPVASTQNRDGFYLSHELDLTFMGQPASDDAAECRGELDRFGVRTFFVFEDSPIYRTFDDAPGWERVLTVDAWRTQNHGALKVFRRRTGANLPGGETR